MSTDTDTTQASWELPEAVWQRMEPLMPPRKSKEGRPQTVDPTARDSDPSGRRGVKGSARRRDRWEPRVDRTALHAPHRGDLLCLAHRDPMAGLSPRTLWPAQHRVLLLPAMGRSWGIWALVGGGADRL